MVRRRGQTQRLEHHGEHKEGGSGEWNREGSLDEIRINTGQHTCTHVHVLTHTHTEPFIAV